MIDHIYHLIKFTILKRKIRNNPHLGEEEKDSFYDYKEGSYEIRYRVIKQANGRDSVEWIYLRRRLSPHEKRKEKRNKNFSNFWRYQRWMILLRPSFIIIFFITVIIFYCGIIEPQKAKIKRLKWIAAQISGIKPEVIRYEGGLLKVSAKKSSLRRESESVTISFNPFGWLFAPDNVKINLWSSKLDKYVSYPLRINERGDVWLGKSKEQVHGKLVGNRLTWDEPQVAGIGQKVSGHHLSIENGRLKIIDE